jgi:hypothetical protein
MENELLELLNKLKSEETFSRENSEMLDNAIEKLESVNTNSDIKEIAILFMRLFLECFDPEKWDLFNN